MQNLQIQSLNKAKYILLFLSLIINFSCSNTEIKTSDDLIYYQNSLPLTRWWWFASEIDTNVVKAQLDWLKENNFGGVEIAFVYPYPGDTSGQKFDWLSDNFSNILSFTKKYADNLHLNCDFTYGTLWPFGDSKVPETYGAMQYGDSISPMSMRLTWESPLPGRVIDHLNQDALANYMNRLHPAFEEALKGNKSALFCDSWEVETKYLWTKDFDKDFFLRYHYDINLFIDSIYSPGYGDYYYDYMKLISEKVINNFYKELTSKSHEFGSFSRAQCSGAPADLISAYSSVDIPESEAILYEPFYSRIPASPHVCHQKK